MTLKQMKKKIQESELIAQKTIFELEKNLENNSMALQFEN
jgi:hypothetical protein